MEFLKETKDKLNAMEDPKEFGKYLYRIFNEYIDYHTSQGENKSWKLRDAIRVILGSFNLFNPDEESEKTNRVRLSKVFGIKGKADDSVRSNLDQMDLNGLYKGLIRHTYNENEDSKNNINKNKILFEKELLGFLNNMKVSVDAEVSEKERVEQNGHIERTNFKLLSADFINRTMADSKYKDCSNYINNLFRAAVKQNKVEDVFNDLQALKLSLTLTNYKEAFDRNVKIDADILDAVEKYKKAQK